MRKVWLVSGLVAVFLVPAFAADEVSITYLGHACFTVTAVDGTVVMIDPYGTYVPYPALPKEADVVLITHGHVDHCPYCFKENDRVLGDPEIVWPFDEEGRVREGERTIIAGLTVKFIEATHVTKKGGGQGLVCLFNFEIDGIHFVHLGDLGQPLTEDQIEALGDVEVLFIPVGGTATIDAAEAITVIESLPSVRVAIPMHYYVSRYCPWPFDRVDVFLDKAEAKWPVQRKGVSQVSVSTETLPEETEVWLLEHER